MPTARLKKAIRESAQAILFPSIQTTKNLLGGTPSILLLFKMQHQVENQWCWAATAVSISQYYNPSSHWTQCQVATTALGISNCCILPTLCNKPWYLERALSITNNFTSIQGALSFHDVELELSNGRVVGARVGWFGGGGHFMVIYGCKTINGINYYYIDDPIYGKSEILEFAFQTAYQGAGSWTHSYITKS